MKPPELLEPASTPQPQGRYFEKSLSDFVHDVASGAAIRHLIDKGYSISQIEKELNYPVPRKRLLETVWEHQINSGIIISIKNGIISGNTKGEIKYQEKICIKDPAALSKKLRKILSEYGEENVYVYCPCKRWLGDAKNSGIIFKCPTLTSRERDYIAEIPWGSTAASYHTREETPCDDTAFVDGTVFGTGTEFYHRLNSRMFEIVLELGAFGEELKIIAL